jgi:GTPase SAR1 family protein
MAEQQIPTFKLVLVGDGGTGKASCYRILLSEALFRLTISPAARIASASGVTPLFWEKKSYPSSPYGHKTEIVIIIIIER